MLQTGDKIHGQLTSMLSGSYRTYLQDAVITMRNNRYCIPIKAEYKGQVNGMIHDQSATGSTYFVEPAAVVELNNKLRELELEEKEEIGRILADLSAQAGAHTEELADDLKIMTLLDFIFAKAELAMDMNATEPVFNDDRSINIRKGRHPLLDKKKVVPIDIHLGRDFDLLVITGPNTGGKTVSLKTVGLFTLMGQAGAPHPCVRPFGTVHFYGSLCGHRGRTEHRAEPVHLLLPYEEHRPHPEPCGRGFPLPLR